MSELSVLDVLYAVKKHILMLENITGNHDLAHKLYDEFRETHELLKDEGELLNMTALLNDAFRACIPDEQYEEWEYSDYECYTDKHHHRKFWNEIENEKIVEDILDMFRSIKRCEWSEDIEYSVELYDFNNEELYFKTEEEMSEFINLYDPAPFTAFHVHDGYNEELYSA